MNFSVKNGKKKDWIYDGCIHINLFESTSYTDINCPFCGQGLNNAINVIDSYKLYFNDKFRHYFDELTKEKSNLKGFVYTILNNIQLFFKQVSTNSLLTSNYSEFISENYQLIRKKTEILSAGLIENLNNLITMINRGAEDFLMTIEQLQQNPFNSVEHPNSQLTLNDSITIIIETVNDYNFCINEINSLIRQLKQKYNAGNFEDILDDEKEALAKLNRLKDRYIYNNDIIQLKSNYEAAEDLKKEITDKEKELFRQHNVFVNTYFHKVNELFQKFDPRKLLTIEEYQDTKGYQPIYGFKLSFLSKQINDKNINKVLSDGDRRALAFSIFLTKIITDKSYENKILIIDDPITSLDDDRTFILEKFVNRLIENNICQIIVLTHISAFVTKLNEFICNSNNINLMKEKEKPGVFKLTWFSTGSSLEKIENANTL